tara:strand:+ start:111 stop:308 length:198 start_codon:yes stop_codon:yes gene_type:complete
MAKKSEVTQMVVENPPPPKKKPSQKDDVKYIGNEMVKLSDRINEIELSIESISQNLKRVMNRMGL